MKKTYRISVLCTLALAAVNTGCQSGGIFSQPTDPMFAAMEDDVILAVSMQNPPPSTQPTTKTAKKSTTSQPANRIYTAPSSQLQQLTFMSVIVGVVPVREAAIAGREISEAALGAQQGLFSSQSIAGRPGLVSQQVTITDAVASGPGLQEGFATGLAFGSPTNNIFTLRANPLAGPVGRCRDLAKAGFFGGSPAACERHFSR
jgi:hypothetical protein